MFSWCWTDVPSFTFFIVIQTVGEGGWNGLKATISAPPE